MPNAIYCINGHYIGLATATAMSQARMRAAMARYEFDDRTIEAFCTTCGAENINACKYCKAPIELKRSKPAFCSGCGKPHPWTETAIKAAKEYADEIEDLSVEDKATLKGTFDDMATNTPRTQLAVARYKRIMQKVASAAREPLYKLMVDVMSETAAKMIKF